MVAVEWQTIKVAFSNIASGDSKPPNLPQNEIKEKQNKHFIMSYNQWKTGIERTLILMVFL